MNNSPMSALQAMLRAEDLHRQCIRMWATPPGEGKDEERHKLEREYQAAAVEARQMLQAMSGLQAGMASKHLAELAADLNEALNLLHDITEDSPYEEQAQELLDRLRPKVDMFLR